MLKRSFDIFASCCIIILFSPIMAVVVWQTIKKFKFPIFFCQVRPGLNGEPFKIIKFRTMTNEVNDAGNLLSDEQRLTPFGKFLRASSLDEMPELWNVLKGKMSLVGPRPLMMEYLPLYNAEQNRRHTVLPGITGWAQIHGRNALSWEDKFALDLWYVDNRSFWLDIKILCLTIKKVWIREGITATDHATTYAFKGNHNESKNT